ncbi:MAG: nucleotide exchange factor GrpE [Pseudomonadota bacterium]
MAEPERAPEVKDAVGAPVAEVENEPAALPSASVSEVEQELQAALAKASENYELFLRAKAEAENVRKRAQEDIAKAHRYAIESFAADLLPVMDSLEKALETDNATVESMRQGIELTLRQLKSAFEKSRLTAIDPKGEKFDPYRHQAISTVPATAACPPNHVAAVFQKGWMIAERVLRPAMVAVARGEDATSASDRGA